MIVHYITSQPLSRADSNIASLRILSTLAAATMIISQPSFSYRLIYFNVRGAAELCRLTLVVSGFDWEDIRYPMAVGQHGFSYGPEFRRDAATGAFAGNFHRLPILQVLDAANNNHRVALVNLGQSHTIARFVARQHPTLGGGGSALQQAKVDSIHECCRDIASAWYQVKRRKDGKREWWETPRPVISDPASKTTEQPPPTTLQGWCGLLEDAIASYNNNVPSSPSSPWCLGGEHATLADLAIYHLLATPSSPISGSTVSFFDGFSNKDQIHLAYASFPRISSVVQACSELPSIRDWEHRRPDTFT